MEWRRYIIVAEEASFLKELAAGEISEYVGNIQTSFQVLEFGNLLLPMTINNTEYESSYICSPYNACISYAQEETAKLKNPIIEIPLKIFLGFISHILKVGKINKVVSLNNWLLSTNLYKDWHGDNVADLTKYLLKEYPQHAIMFRSLNQYTNCELMENFRQAGYELIPSRQVYIINPNNTEILKKPNLKRDINMLQKTDYQLIEHSEILSSDFCRIAELYNYLYLDKYSKHNPHYTEKLIRLWHRHKILEFYGLRNKDGILDGIIGLFRRGDTGSAPLVGYDTSISQSVGLYRMLIAIAFRDSIDKQIIFNISSGASHFKRLRGAKPTIEYSSIYIKHLPAHQQIIWKVLGAALKNIFIPLVEKYEL